MCPKQIVQTKEKLRQKFATYFETTTTYTVDRVLDASKTIIFRLEKSHSAFLFLSIPSKFS